MQRRSVSPLDDYPSTSQIIVGIIPSRLFEYTHASGRGVIWRDMSGLRGFNAIAMVVTLDGGAGRPLSRPFRTWSGSVSRLLVVSLD